MSDRRQLLEKIDALVGEIGQLKERAYSFCDEADQLERQAEHKREQHRKLFVEIRRRNGEIDGLIAELRRETV